MSIIPRFWNGINIGQRIDDGYVDATALCKAHNDYTGETKKPNDWLRKERHLKTIAHLAVKLGIADDSLLKATPGALKEIAESTGFWRLVIVNKGGLDRTAGTWIHPRLAVRFGIWLSDEFGYQVEEWVAEWMRTGENPIQPAPTVTREQIIRELIPAKPLVWEKRYGDDFWYHLHRLTTYRQGNIQCAFFIRKHIYDYFPSDVCLRLEEVNPLINGKRKNLIHQHFDGGLLKALIQHLMEVLILMQAAQNIERFEELMTAKFRGIYEIKIPAKKQTEQLTA